MDYAKMAADELLQAADGLAARSQADQATAQNLRYLASLKKQVSDLEATLPASPEPSAVAKPAPEAPAPPPVGLPLGVPSVEVAHALGLVH